MPSSPKTRPPRRLTRARRLALPPELGDLAPPEEQVEPIFGLPGFLDL
jgi:hypothetical protein